MILAIAPLRNLQVHQMDVKTTFLNGDLEKAIYMEQPESFSTPGQKKKVCKLVKFLHGLKQAPNNDMKSLIVPHWKVGLESTNVTNVYM